MAKCRIYLDMGQNISSLVTIIYKLVNGAFHLHMGMGWKWDTPENAWVKVKMTTCPVRGYPWSPESKYVDPTHYHPSIYSWFIATIKLYLNIGKNDDGGSYCFTNINKF